MDKRGRTKILIGIFAILLVALFLILFVKSDSINTQVYDGLTKTATIKDVSNADIASVTLNTPQDNLVGAGYQMVAQFTINPNQDYSNILGNFEFYNLRDGNKAITRQIDAKYLTTQQVSVDDFTTECSEALNENGTTSQFCNQVKTGSHLENKEVWVDFDNSVKINEPIIIGLFTNVEIGDRVEWVPTIAGVKISEWAIWTQSLNVGLIHYYNFEDTSTNLTDVANSSGINGAKLNTPENATGRVIWGNHFTKTDPDGYNFTKAISDGSGVGTLNFWVNTPDLTSNTFLMGRYNVAGQFNARVQDDGSFTFDVMGSGGGENLLTTNVSGVITPNTWHMATLVWGTGGTQVWLDGVLGKTDPSITQDLTFPYWEIGGRFTDANYGTFTLDEIGVWNRRLTPDEIIQLYNNSYGITYTNAFDITPPSTTQPIITPSNPNSSVNLYCNATLTDDLQTNLTAYWTWYKNNVSQINGSTELINGNGTNSLITTLSVGNTTKGEQWICEVKPYDGYNYGNVSNSTAVTILNSAPTQTNPLLATPSGKNLSTENLTCYNQSTFDADGDVVTDIYNWYKNSQPWTALNLPFEINANDYSGNNNNGTIYGNPQFVTGKFGRALHFNGINQSINISDSNSLDITNQISIETWIKLDSLNKTMILDKNLAYRLWLPNATTSTFVLALYIGGSWANVTSNTALSTGTWYHLAATYNGSTIKLYINGIENKNQAVSGLIGTSSQKVIIGTYNGSYYLNGTIDELKIYNRTLTPEQISADSNLEYNKIVSQETSGGDNYLCQITPNDGEADGAILNSTNLSVLWGITFNVTDSFSNASLSNVIIHCNSTDFNQLGVTTNPYGPYGFMPGSYNCVFARNNYFNKTMDFVVNVDKMINISLSLQGGITNEEHTWLEAIYNCVVSGDCNLYNLLININNTVTDINNTVKNIWENTKPTDQSVIVSENVTNKVVNSTRNLTIDYSVNIPIKAGYTIGTYLPVRIGFWFLNISNNVTCFNQGDRPTGVTGPYCQPLITEVVGPMGGQVNFTVNLKPNVTLANYTIKRIVDIDPNNVWINYGQEAIGIVDVKENSNSYGITSIITGEDNPSLINSQQQILTSSPSSSGSSKGDSVTNVYNTYVTNGNNTATSTSSKEGVTHLDNTGITGGVIGSLLSSGNIIISIVILSGLFTVFIIFRIKNLKKK